jgi:hypothetical protein
MVSQLERSIAAITNGGREYEWVSERFIIPWWLNISVNALPNFAYVMSLHYSLKPV